MKIDCGGGPVTAITKPVRVDLRTSPSEVRFYFRFNVSLPRRKINADTSVAEWVSGYIITQHQCKLTARNHFFFLWITKTVDTDLGVGLKLLGFPVWCFHSFRPSSASSGAFLKTFSLFWLTVFSGRSCTDGTWGYILIWTCTDSFRETAQKAIMNRSGSKLSWYFQKTEEKRKITQTVKWEGPPREKLKCLPLVIAYSHFHRCGFCDAFILCNAKRFFER